jgi:hypothetical protein
MWYDKNKARIDLLLLLKYNSKLKKDKGKFEIL